MRVFVGIDLNDTWRTALAAGAATVRDSGPGWAGDKWVPAENLHITLKFFGDVPDDAGPMLGPDLAVALRGFAPVILPMREAVFPVNGAKRASMLWTRFDDPEGACADLVARIEDVAADYGIVPDSKVFSPHVTLCRTRSPRVLTNQAAATAQALSVLGTETTMSVPSITVFRSKLTKSRPLYDRLAVVELDG